MKAEPLYTKQEYENAIKFIIGEETDKLLKVAGIRGTSLLNQVVFEIFIKRLEYNPAYKEACEIIRTIAIDLQITGIFQFKQSW